MEQRNSSNAAQVFATNWRIRFLGNFSVAFGTEDSPSGLWRSLGKRVGLTPSGVRTPYPPPDKGTHSWVPFRLALAKEQSSWG